MTLADDRFAFDLQSPTSGRGRQPALLARRHPDGLAGNAGIKEESRMRLDEREVIIQNIIDECTHEKKRADKVLLKWRATLEKEPTRLMAFQIDEIVREVRRRLDLDE